MVSLREESGSSPSTMLDSLRLQQNRQSRLHDVADENLLNVLQFLDGVSLRQVEATDAKSRQLAQTKSLWLDLCRADFRFDGEKQDYTHRWRVEKKRARANLELYVHFLDEIYFSASAALCLMVLFVVMPLMGYLDADAWTQFGAGSIFSCVYVLAFPALFYGLVRVTLLSTLLSAQSALRRSIDYNSVRYAVNCVLWNRGCGSKMLLLFAAFLFVGGFPISMQLYLSETHDSVTAVFFFAWATMVGVAVLARRMKRHRRNKLWLALSCGFACSVVLFLRHAVDIAMSSCVLALPLLVLMGCCCIEICQVASRCFLSPRQAHASAVDRMLRFAKDSGEVYFRGFPPLGVLSLILLRYEFEVAFPPSFMAIDYLAWLAFGPAASAMTYIWCILVREMPIPQDIRRL